MSLIRFSPLLLCLTLLGCKRQYNVPSALREVVPVTIVYDPARGNAPIPEVSIQLGDDDTSFVVLFDTGSPGLRIMKTAIDNVSFQETNQLDTVRYGSIGPTFGVAGDVVKSTFTIGTLKTASPIAVMAIDKASYAGTTFASTGDSVAIAGLPLKKLCGIMGVGMRAEKDGVVSPLAQLPGNAKYIIQFPTYGGASGRLIINPNVEDLAGFYYFHLKPGTPAFPGNLNSWNDRNLYGCFTVGQTSYWAPTFLDTGNPDVYIGSPTISVRSVVPPGASVTFGLADTISGDFRVTATVPVQAMPLEGRDIFNLEPDASATNFAAIMPFFLFDVLYDQTDGIIGLRHK